MKKIIIIAVSVLLLIGIGIGCILLIPKGEKSGAKPADTETVRMLLGAISQNISQFSQKGYVVSFTQEYSVTYKNSTDLEDVDFSISYSGEGIASLSYVLDGEVNAEPKLSDLFSSRSAFLTGEQTERIRYFNNEVRKIDGEEIPRTDDTDYGIDHEFTIKIDGDCFYAASESSYFDYKDSANNKTDSFSGKIDKNALKGSVSDEELTKAFSGLLFMEAWGYIDQLKGLANDYLKELDFSNEEAIENFIRDNGIEETEEGTAVYIYFTLRSNDVLSGITGESVDNIADVKGTVKFDKESENVLYFKYDLGDCLLSMLEESGKDMGQFDADVKGFVIEGGFFNESLEDVPLDREFTEYPEDAEYEFINQFLNHIIPFYSEEG